MTKTYAVVCSGHAVIITHANHTTYLAKVGLFNMKKNPSAQVHYKKSSIRNNLVLTAQLALYRGRTFPLC